MRVGTFKCSFFLQVKEIMSLLWTKEAQLCSYLSDIQHNGVERKEGHSMFFLESVLVPPIKFRPPAHSGDSVCLFFSKDPSLSLIFIMFIYLIVDPCIRPC